MPEKIINPFAVATSVAKRKGYKDFSEGSPGKEKRSDIAEAIKREMKKMELEKGLPTWVDQPKRRPSIPKEIGGATKWTPPPPRPNKEIKKDFPLVRVTPPPKPNYPKIAADIHREAKKLSQNLKSDIDADEHFDAFAKFMKKEYGVDLEKDKKPEKKVKKKGALEGLRFARGAGGRPKKKK